MAALITLALVLVSTTRSVDRLGHRCFGLLGRISRHRSLLPLLVASVSLAVGAFFTLAVKTPIPRVHDEFSYLLAADTFAQGRLTNPPLPDPLWQHLETMHVIQQPTYASKYPPAQGGSLALGQVIFGRPIIGAWISTALACGAVCWMLLAWLPPRWALIGGLLIAVHVQTVSWSQSYWGGQLGMLGGSLLLGALLRFRRHGVSMTSGLAMGVGIAVLANSRPAEGLVLSILVLAVLLWYLLQRRLGDWRTVARGLVLPVLAVLTPVAGFMAYYNYRVTGSAVRMPYQVHDEQYAVAPPFIWQSPRSAPTYRHQTIHDLQVGWELPYYETQQTWSGLARELVRKTAGVAIRYFDPTVLALALVPLAWAWRSDQRVRFGLLLLGTFFLLVALTQTWARAHYVSPAAGLGVALVVLGLRRLRLWQRNGRQGGRIAVRTIYGLCLVTLVLWGIVQAQEASLRDWAAVRAEWDEQLRSDGEGHLIMVRYQPGHDMMMEWVANKADVHEGPVVWAREMGEGANRRLREHFADRRVWLVSPDDLGFQLLPYGAAKENAPATQPQDRRGTP